jgi:Carboxypeptidase regulatory-like domain
MKKLSFITCCLLLVVLANSALGQRILGEFTGTITDPNGGKVVGAKVTAVDPAIGRTWTGQTNEDGVYRLVSLPTGTRYDVSVEHQGFKTARQDQIPLDVGEAKRLDFSLEVGQVSEMCAGFCGSQSIKP